MRTNKSRPTGLDSDWQLIRGTYNPDEFYTATKNEKDHSAHVSTAMHPDIDTAVRELVSLRELPYRTVGDFYRNAAVHQLMKDRDRVKNPEVRSTVAAAIYMEQLVEKQLLMKRFLDLLEHIDDVINMYRGKEGGDLEVAKFVQAQLDEASSIPDGFWHSWVLSEINKRYGKHLHGK